MDHEYVGKYFVWTKMGRRPRYVHETYEGALKEAKRLAKNNPGRKFIVQHWLDKVSTGCPQSQVGRQKENDMKTIWYGNSGSNVQFAESASVLTDNGVENPQSFTVDGSVHGLTLIGQNNSDQNAGVGTSSPQSAA